MIGRYKRNDGIIFDVIQTKKGFERGNYKDFGNRLFTRVTKEVLERELLIGEIEKL